MEMERLMAESIAGPVLSKIRVSAPARWAKAIVKRSAESVIEWRLGVRTGGSTLPTHVAGGIHRDSTWYEPLNYITLNKCLAALNLNESDVVFDIGCGLGRVLCVLARRRVRKVVGIELSSDFAEVARVNVGAMRGRVSPVEVVEADAATADYDEGTAFYTFNSFGGGTTAAVLEHIHRSVLRRPRPIRIVYVNPIHNHVFESAGWLRRGEDVRSPWYEMHGTLWTYDPGAN